MRRFLFKVLFLFSFLVGSQAMATTYYVDSSATSTSATGLAPTDPLKSVNAAVSSASSGDTIQIAAGSYEESVDLQGKDLVIVGAGVGQTVFENCYEWVEYWLDPETVTLDYEQCEVAFNLVSGEGPTTEIKDLSIQGYSTGINFESSSGNVDNVEISDTNVAISSSGAGSINSITNSYFHDIASLVIYVADRSEIQQISGCTFELGAEAVRAIDVADNNTLLITKNDFSGDPTSENYGVYINGGFSNVTVANNTFEDVYYAVYTSGTNSTRYSNNVISGNTIEGGTHGIYSKGSYEVSHIYNNTISKTESTGLYFYSGSRATAYNNIIKDNEGHGVYLYGANAKVFHNNIRGNSATFGAGVYARDGDTTHIENNLIFSNNRYGVYVSGSSPNTVMGYSCFYGNSLGDVQGAFTDLGGHVHAVLGIFPSGRKASTGSTIKKPIEDCKDRASTSWIAAAPVAYNGNSRAITASNPRPDIGANEY